MEISIVSAWTELPDSALSLLAAAEENCLFSGRHWFDLFSHQVAQRALEPQWLLLIEEGKTQIALPMAIDHQRHHRTLFSLSNFYTPYFNAIGSESDINQKLGILFRLAAGFFRRFDTIVFSPLTPAVADLFARASRQLNFSVEVSVQTYNWRETQVADFDNYWSSRESSLRNTARRKQKKLQELGGYVFSIAATDSIEHAIRDYNEVYSKSWKSEENYPGFVEQMIRVYAQSGALRLGFAHHHGSPVATQIWLVNSGTAHIYKLAYDQAFQHLSVGTLLTRYLAQKVINEDSVKTLDYLTGDDGYKAQWMSDRRPLHKLTLANPRRPRGAALALKSKLRSLIRSEIIVKQAVN